MTKTERVINSNCTNLSHASAQFNKPQKKSKTKREHISLARSGRIVSSEFAVLLSKETN